MADHWIDAHLGVETVVRAAFVSDLETHLSRVWSDDEIVPRPVESAERRRPRMIVWLGIAAAAAVATTVYFVQRSTEHAISPATTRPATTAATTTPATSTPTTTTATTTTISADAPPL